ncbi:Uncharacterized protein PODLI_1B017247 [Podarcis lilfordi]|uniref:Family with sequence similarity 162 member A n=1 Tax=Podarcis lilfordi TaxID=74358 RepID=A0AA35PPH2_9SAUR|nr:Uncharacterized protein PODLI_1B017247 [Podarcis lilfordi]
MFARLFGHRPLATLCKTGAFCRSHGTGMTLTRTTPLPKTEDSVKSRLASPRTFSGHRAFRNERRPTKLDKKVLLWLGRFKKEEDIPHLLSVEVLKAAQSQLRIQICYIMIALTLLGCMTMIISGKMAVKREDTLLKINAEKKAKWRAEGQVEKEAMAGKSEQP